MNRLIIKISQWSIALLIINGLAISQTSALAKGKLLATPGVSQVEGSGGGGIVPWAQLAGYATSEQVSAGGFCSRGKVTDYSLNVCGLQLNLFDRVELSYAKQSFDITGNPAEIEQDIASIKVRLYGDLVYSCWPQISLGLQHKSLDDPSIAFAVGADEDSGTDVYLAFSKLHLAALGGYNAFWNVTLRHTEANQIGLLGYGGQFNESRLQFESSVAIFLSKNIAIGAEYRQKPDNLNLGETHWRDLFVAWFPNKSVSLTAAYLDLGSIAGVDKQTGWYFSIMGNL